MYDRRSENKCNGSMVMDPTYVNRINEHVVKREVPGLLRILFSDEKHTRLCRRVKSIRDA
jgi:hypothetical protein